MLNRKLLVLLGLLVLFVALATADVLAQRGRELQVNDQLVPIASSQASSSLEPGTVEVLKRDADGSVTLARVYLSHPFSFFGGRPNSAWTSWTSIRSMRPYLVVSQRSNLSLDSGIWSFLIKGDEGVVVIDPGQEYVDAWFRGCTGEKTLDDQYVMDAVQEYFPGQKIREIIITHWHNDHSQNGPRLQQVAFDHWGFRPPLRIGIQDKFYPDEDGSMSGAEQVFRDACYEEGSWEWGLDLVDGDYLTGTSFKALHLPGHTFGNFGFVSDAEEVGIVGEWYFMPEGSSMLDMFLGFMNDDPDAIPESKEKFYNATEAKGYTVYSSHPPMFDCAASAALEGQPGASQKLNALRGFRDEVLVTSPIGKRYMNLYYKHSPEVSWLLLSDSALRARASRLLKQYIPALQDLSEDTHGRASAAERMVLAKERVQEIEALLDDFAEKASPELRAVIWEVKGQLRTLEGKTLREIWVAPSRDMEFR